MAYYKKKSNGTGKTVHDILTERIMEKLENGVVPWERPWVGASGPPIRMYNMQPYRGINVFLLGCEGFASPYWGSLKHINDKGGSIKKGEHGSLCIFSKPDVKRIPVDGENGEEDFVEKKRWILRYYKVFNLQQTEGLEGVFPEPEKFEFNPIEKCESIIEGMPNRPELRHGGGRAFYRPSDDFVQVPEREHFKSPEGYYAVTFHEFVHSTGHESRLKRDIRNLFGNHKYSKEELVAEMGASFLCGVAGIENSIIDNSAAYIASWLKALKNDKTMVYWAAQEAQKAAEYILGDNGWGEEEDGE